MMLIAAFLLAAQAGDDLAYEGIARDNFAAWSFTSGEIAYSDGLATTSVQALYDTPTPFNGNPTPVAYSIHKVAFDCAAKTATFISGANFSASGAEITPASPSGALPWSDYTTGFQTLAETVCAMKAP